MLGTPSVQAPVASVAPLPLACCSKGSSIGGTSEQLSLVAALLLGGAAPFFLGGGPSGFVPAEGVAAEAGATPQRCALCLTFASVVPSTTSSRSVSTARAPRAAARTPGMPTPAPSSRTLSPRNASAWQWRWRQKGGNAAARAHEMKARRKHPRNAQAGLHHTAKPKVRRMLGASKSLSLAGL